MRIELARCASLPIFALVLGCSAGPVAPTSCVSSRECSAAGLVCDVALGRCVACAVDADCLGTEEVCRSNACQAVVHCTSSRQCPGLVCDMTAGICVDCVRDADCTSGSCVANVCVVGRDTGIGDGDAATRDAGIDAPSIDAFAPDAFAPPDDAFTIPNDTGVLTGIVTFGASGSIVTYTVPTGITRLLIEADGASGGDAVAVSGMTYAGGHGAHVSNVVTVASGQVLSIAVGAQPPSQPAGMDGCGASGGGGTFVVRGSSPLVVAGGGGGATPYATLSAVGGDASLTTSGGSSGMVAGGVGGSGGGAVTFEGGGGGGMSTAGADGEGIGGQSFATGAAGGARASTEACGTIAAGGFGGGGGGGNDFGGGGGGFSGGAARDNSGTIGLQSGGGGSFASATATITLRSDHGDGRVTITPM